MSARRWALPAAWGAVILVATSIPSPRVPSPVQGGDKLAHLALYAVLGFLAARAAAAPERPTWRTALLVVAGAAAFGALDEWHQSLIPGRATELGDWIADVAGAALGSLVAGTALLRRERLT